jgi:hypothetical protein
MRRTNEGLQKELIKTAKQPKVAGAAYQRAAVQQRFAVIGGAVAGAVNRVELLTQVGFDGQI